MSAIDGPGGGVRLAAAMNHRAFIVAFLAVMIVGPAVHGRESNMVAGNIRAVKVEGTAWQIVSGSGQRERLQEGDFLRQGNAVETTGDGGVILLFDNGSTMNLRPNTIFSIDQFLRDPFEAEKVDYTSIKSEPSRSVTKVKVREGTMYFDIPKLDKGSVCDIANQVGTAGIRGTAGFVADNSMGVTKGLVQVQTISGQTQSLGAGQNTGITPQGDLGPPPADAGDNMKGAENNSQNARQNTPSDAFAGAPQNQAASDASLTPEQQETLDEAAKEGESALVEAVKEIAGESPESAAAAAAAAAALMPEAAPQIASAAASAVPQSQATALAPQIAEAVASAVPQSQAASLAPQIAAQVAQAVEGAAAQVAAAVTSAVPNSAPEIAGAVTSAVPSQATAIAQSVAQAAPSQTNSIAQAVTNAAPDADSTAIANAAQQGAQQGSNQSGPTTGATTGQSSGQPPALPPGSGGGGGGGSSGGGSIYSN